MVKQKQFFFIWVFLICCIVIGGLLGFYIVGRETGEFNFDTIVPSVLVGVTLGSLVSFLLYKWNKRKNGNVPQVDERSIVLLKRYLIGVLYIVLIGVGAACIFLYAIGVETVELGMIIVCLAGLYLLIGLGAMVVKRL
ncbi:hypothetical protein [Aquibacillus rhizosphaerae]|uniref:DUF2178 domain-containing protein n=1 Tax=Aquibacillus rhizosphaerae TaxID=3051431 RepID=A0ABT7L980_9BACI|nr:hypothetical protein [Aquibacillus sp. LR5S19]MDL4842417.1 hypothetical protein [Aquibacillus sp. LR5S19]